MYFGVDWNGPLPDSDDFQQVEVPLIPSPPNISKALLTRITGTFTLEYTLSSQYHAVDVYVQLLELVQ